MALSGLNHPLTGPSGHLSPCPGEGKAAAAMRAFFQPGFLSPGQGERWLPKADGEGVVSPSAMH